MGNAGRNSEHGGEHVNVSKYTDCIEYYFPFGPGIQRSPRVGSFYPFAASRVFKIGGPITKQTIKKTLCEHPAYQGFVCAYHSKRELKMLPKICAAKSKFDDPFRFPLM